MDRRCKVAQLQVVAHGNGYLGDRFSRPPADNARSQNRAVIVRMILINPSRSISVDGAIDFTDIERLDEQILGRNPFACQLQRPQALHAEEAVRQ